MRCLQCGSENEQGSGFCTNCGAPLVLTTPRPSTATPAQPPTAILCRSCGTENEQGSRFCTNCGAPLVLTTPRPSTTTPAQRPAEIPCRSCGAPNSVVGVFCSACGSSLVQVETSWAWWLLPIFFGWIGGLLAWLAVKQGDKIKARRMLLLGIGLSIIWFFFIVLIAITAP